VSQEPPILRVGLTGGIASGKTTVAGFLSELGASVVDADRVAHDLLAPGGAAHDELLERFGREILDSNGEIDRRRLGEIVFNDPEALADLNRIMHPKVRAEAERRFAGRRAAGGGRIEVFDAALLVETGAYRNFDCLVVAWCDRETQVARLRARDGFGEREALLRIAAQTPLDEKRALADYVVDTSTTLDETRRQASEVYAALRLDLDRKSGGTPS
jgi:dephospho-CoA kinase